MIVYDKLHKKFGFSNSQLKILELVGSNKKVLEVGSSTGYMTKALKLNKNLVDVIEIDQKAAKSARKYARRVVIGSVEELETLDSLKETNYDFVVMADVLEHLVYPEVALKNLLKIVKNSTKLIISLPNIASWPMRKQLFFKGDFTYQESGILDKTHLHFYTVESLPKLLDETGWRAERLIGTISLLPLEQTFSKIPILGFFFVKFLKPIVANLFKNLSFPHFVTVARKK